MGWVRFAASVLAVAATAATTNAGAVSAPHPVRCTVVGAERLPGEAGNAASLCSAVERAVAAQAPGAHYTAEVRVVSDSMLAAKLVVGGRALPEQKFAVMDRRLNQSSIERFAQSIATKVASAARP